MAVDGGGEDNNDFADKCTGSEQARMVTRYRATALLLNLRAEWKLRMLMDIELARNTECPDSPTARALVVLHSGRLDPATGAPLSDNKQKKPISFIKEIARSAQPIPGGWRPHPQAIKNGMDYFRAIEDTIERINRSNLEHGWSATRTHSDGTQSVFQPNVCIRQIHVGEFFRAVRLYSWGELSGQNLSKEVRRGMRIDGQPVAELDFAGLHIRMLYQQKGGGPPNVPDIYQPERVLPRYYGFANATAARRAIIRDFVKRATNLCWNVNSRGAAHSAIGKMLAEHAEKKFLGKVIFDLERLGGVAEVVDRLMATHPKLRSEFFTGYGIELMTVDGLIMKHIMIAFANAGIPALPIHDSLVCRATDVVFARETMAAAYKMITQFEPVIRRVY